jgi:hypothetical protein
MFAADKIRIGYSGMTISNAMLWVTEERKLFEKDGIDAEVLYLQTTGKNADAKDFVETRFIEEFDRSGYIDGLYRQ